MAIVHVADWTAPSGSGFASISGNTTPANALIVVVFQTAVPATSHGVTDNGGNAYTFVTSAAGGSNNSTVYMYYAKNANPTTSISVSATGGSATFAACSIFTGADLSAPMVDSQGQSNPSVVDPSPATVTAVAGGCVVGVLGVGVSTRSLSLQNASTYTQFIDIKGSSRNMLAARGLSTAAGDTAPDWLIASGGATSTFEVTAAFKPAGSGTPTITWSYWNGSSEQALSMEGYWNGSAVVPFTATAVEVV